MLSPKFTRRFSHEPATHADGLAWRAPLDQGAKRGPRSRRLLLGGTSAVALLMLLSAGTPAHARCLFCAAGATNATNAAANAAMVSAQQAAQIAQQSQQSLARSAAAIQALQAMQNAARSAALAGPNNLGADPNHPGTMLPNVPDGLRAGGLVPDSGLAGPGAANPVSTWVNANTPVQTTSNGQTTVVIQQTASQALLNWITFNVGKNTIVQFNQRGNSSWIALNKINDPSGVPSQILGQIRADGQVYLINRNGIIFGGTSQINVGTLVASALPIDDSLFNAGTMFSNLDAQYLFSSYAQTGGGKGPTNPSTTDAATNATQDSKVLVQPGAIINATESSTTGGRVILIGPQVENDGSILTPDGQTILAAGQQVAFMPHSSTETSLRGLDVYIGAVLAPVIGVSSPSLSSASSISNLTTGQVINAGLIEADRGNISLAGQAIIQNGALVSTTSASLNGRIDLSAVYNVAPPGAQPLPVISGMVNLGVGSLIQILPELTSSETIVGSLAQSSQINIKGSTVYMAPGAEIEAPGAVQIQPGPNAPAGAVAEGGVTINALNQIYIDNSATIDVSGSEDVQVPVSQNILAVQLFGAQLADSPLQRTGPLRGQTVFVDIRQTGTNPDGSTWIGTPLADATGFASLIQHTVGELTTNGGMIHLAAGGSVVLQRGSTLNVSGGWIDYQGGFVSTSRLIGADGHIYDISKATPDRVYVGILGGFTVDHSRWNVTETFAGLGGGHFDPGYIQGGSGGSISINAATSAIDGDLIGLTVTGPRQRQPMPSSTIQSIAGTDITALVQPLYLPAPSAFQLVVSSSQDVTIQAGVGQQAAPFGPSFSLDPTATLYLSSSIVNVGGFGSLGITTGGTIRVLSDLAFQPNPNSSLTLTATNSNIDATANIDVEANITVPGGTINIASNLSTNQQGLATFNPQSRSFNLGSGVSLSTAGLVVDDSRGSSTPGVTPLVINGGSIGVSALALSFASGSVIDVSGGVAIAANGKQSFGNAGSIQLGEGLVADPVTGQVLFGGFTLGATLKGYGVGTTGKGGSLSITASSFQIGGASFGPNAPSGSLLLVPDFFNQGGFANFKLTGHGPVTIAANTAIDPQIESYLPVSGNSGTVLTPGLLPALLRNPASLTFSGTSLSDNSGRLVLPGMVMGQGSSIRLDPTSLGTGSVAIGGDITTILGSIVVPGGSISLSSAATADIGGAIVNPGITGTIGSSAVLSTAGAIVATVDSRGNPLGSVLGGGSITVSGNFVADPNALLDVSGTSGVINVQSVGRRPVATRVDSDGGSITLKNTLFFPAILRGDRGGPTALGGSLNVNVELHDPSNNSEIGTVEVVQSWASANASPFVNFFAVDSFTNGHFDSLGLGQQVTFSGPVNITAARSITVAPGGVLTADSPVTLSAPYVAIGTPYAGPSAVTASGGLQLVASPALPTYGSGTLSIIATDLIDVGSVGLRNIHSTALTAIGGDIRGYGAFEASGAITMTAAQVYPTTETAFTIAAFDASVNVRTSTLGGTTVILASLPPSGFGVGSSLLGSTVQSINGTTVTLASGANATLTNGTLGSTPEVFASGSVTFNRSGTNPLPLSAGGQLDVFSTTIVQDGVLRAPLGVINLGSTIPQAALVPSSNIGATTNFEVTTTLTLGAGSITSVSAIDPITGQGLIIPYGTMLNGINWIDPTGVDISNGGVPAKTINLAGASVTIGAGSTLDIRGGGDLYAYNFVKGLGGTNDILASSNSFAIIPGYAANYAPLLAINKKNTDGSTSPESGWSNSKLSVGDQITLTASTNGLPAGTYTLLPARYALLPGAFLITPMKGTAVNVGVARPDGSSVVSGAKYNSLDTSHSSLALQPSLFEVDSSAVVHARAEYDNFLGSATLAQLAQANNLAVPRLPVDGGTVNVTATADMIIKGAVQASAGPGGLGGLANISTADAIIINNDGSVTGTTVNTLYLSATDLSNFGADSLLIGSTRTTTSSGNIVTPTTASIEVANDSAHPLTGPDVILASSQTLTLDVGADVEMRGSLSSPAQVLQLGIAPAGQTANGNGALLRVSSDTNAQIVRRNVPSTSNASLVIGAGATISGNGVILDSSGVTSFDATASLSGKAVTLGSHRISLQLNNPGALQTSDGLVLPSAVLTNLQASITSLSLLSYSSIDIYGHGTIGSGAFGSLILHAGGIRGFNAGQDGVTFNAQNVSIDNVLGEGAVAAVPGVDDTPAGTLTFNANTVTIGVNAFNVVGYANLDLNAANGVLVQGTGGLSTAGNLTVTTAVITGAAAANQTISAGGALTVNAASGTPLPTDDLLGATLSLVGASVTENAGAAIVLRSGILTLHATGGDVTVAGTLDVSGTKQTFFDQTKYTGGGQITLTSDTGNVTLSPGSTVTVAANSGGGNAGTLSISAPNGIFTDGGAMLGGASAALDPITGLALYQSGAFSLDVGQFLTTTTITVNTTDFNTGASTGTTSVTGASLASLSATLDASGFTAAKSVRIHNGNVIVDGTTRANNVSVSADSGSITVTGTIDASGVTDGAISLYAYNGVTLAPNSLLTVAARRFDAAGKGGSVDIETGEARAINGVMTSGVGWIDLQGGSTIDLSVAGGVGGTLHLRAPQITGVTASGGPIPTAAINVTSGTTSSGNPTAGTDVAIKPINATIINPSSVVVEGFQVFDLTNSSGSYTDLNGNNVTVSGGFIGHNITDPYDPVSRTGGIIDQNGQAFAGNMADITQRLLGGTINANLGALFHMRPGEELVTQRGDMTLPRNQDWNFYTDRYGPNAGLFPGSGEPGILTLRAAGNLVLLSSITDGFMPIQQIGGMSVQDYLNNIGLGYDPRTQRWNDILLPAGAQSWSYRLTAGADLSAVDFHQVVPLSKLPAGSGSIQLGIPADFTFGTSSSFPYNDPNRTGTSGNYDLMQKYFQVIRTGTGDIDVAAGRDVQLLNPFASIYTAGTQVNPISTSTFNPGGTLNLAANVPIVFPNAPGALVLEPSNITILGVGESIVGIETVTASTNGTITYRPSIMALPADNNNCSCNPALDLQAVPQRSVFTFSSATNVSNVSGIVLSWTATNGLLTTPGAIQLNIPAATTISNIPSGVPVMFGGGIVTVSSAGTITVGSITQRFAPGTLAVGGGIVVFDSPATITGTYFLGTVVTLPQGTYNVTGAGGVGLNFVSAGTTLTKLSAGGGLFEDYSGFVGNLLSTPIPSVVVTIPLQANTPTVLLPGMNSITLSGNGTLSMSSQPAAVQSGQQPLGSTTPEAMSYYTPSLAPNLTSYAFDTPNVGGLSPAITTQLPGLFSTPQYSTGGGNVRITAGEDILHPAVNGAYDAASQELPTNWLYRRGSATGGEFAPAPDGDIASTTWWIDFSNFTQGVGALGGGNVTLKAGRDVVNVDAVVPTNAWTPYNTTTSTVNTQTSKTISGASNGSVTTSSVSPDGTVTTTVTVTTTINPDGTTTTTTATNVVDARAADQQLFEYGGGNLAVAAGRNISGGIYYVEKGAGTLVAGGSILSNTQQAAVGGGILATTLFLGKGSFDVQASGDVTLGAVANPFLLPQGILNGTWDRSYFSTYAPTDAVDVSSLGGSITPNASSLSSWYGAIAYNSGLNLMTNPSFLLTIDASNTGNGSTDGVGSAAMTSLLPPALRATAFSGNISIDGRLTLMPSSVGTVDLEAKGSVGAFQLLDANDAIYQTGTINLSDASPASFPTPNAPLPVVFGGVDVTGVFNALLGETGATQGQNARPSVQQVLHDPTLLHTGDTDPARIYAVTGDVTGLTIFSAKTANIAAGRDIVDVAFYLQNLNPDDISSVVAGRDIILYDASLPVRLAVQQAITQHQSQQFSGALSPVLPGDVSIGGPGTLDVFAGRNLSTGNAAIGSSPNDGTGLGIVSIGNARNPYLPFDHGATVTAAAGMGALFGAGVSSTSPNFAAFIAAFLNPATAGAEADRYLPDLGTLLDLSGAGNQQIWAKFQTLSIAQQNSLALDIFYLVLRDSGRDHNGPNAVNGTRNYEVGFQAIATLFPGGSNKGDITLTAREIKTEQGGDINLLAPGGQVLVGFDLGNKQPIDQGILTLESGNINIFANGNVEVGTSKIFTFRGGNEVIWSSTGNIAAGAASKTLVSAPPARFLVDPQTGAGTLDPAGLATGGGIGVLQTIKGAPPGNIDLIAPVGFIDAGDAGIRSSGNINLAAITILNAGNIQAQGTITGVPIVLPPPVAALTSATNQAGAAQQNTAAPPQGGNTDRPSVIIVEFLGFGGGDGNEPSPPDGQRKNDGNQGYNTNSALQFVKFGDKK